MPKINVKEALTIYYISLFRKISFSFTYMLFTSMRKIQNSPKEIREAKVRYFNYDSVLLDCKFKGFKQNKLGLRNRVFLLAIRQLASRHIN